MTNLSDTHASPRSARNLATTTLSALAIALLILLTAVLPAEFGIDPTGLGRTMGLDKLHQAGASSTRLEPPIAVWKSAGAPRSNTIRVPLMPGQGAEIKSVMNPGDNFVFSWQVEGGSVSFDMHGEKPDAHGAFTSYWIGENQREASGSFTAPFAGSHGWYWENNGTEPVTVVLQTHGFYGDLYMP
ncbi:hypothetical protein ADIMK_2043 [Marinobacterium lacunae]|uniref:Transmembrane anchor protein n=1 Tax=Marinobacterium lacunae TaxID=1232683 RepID=A0A081FYY6_9GAMM|nr:hypothetical protein [Marinobacterium lacunae]KEA63741.1 hypothetical protein ADIMK_2043 [Marinobacterium lacunae]